jgi:hypothetical protein
MFVSKKNKINVAKMERLLLRFLSIRKQYSKCKRELHNVYTTRFAHFRY